MGKKLVVVGLDGIMWKTDLFTQTIGSMRTIGLLDGEIKAADNAEANLKIISEGIARRTGKEAGKIGNIAADRCLRKLEPEIIGELQELSPDTHAFVAMSSAPRFAVRAAARKLSSEINVPFSRCLSSEFQYDDDILTGNYTQLNKKEAVMNLLAATEMPKVELGFVNGVSDQSWVNLCVEVAPVNAKNGFLSWLASDMCKAIVEL